MLALNTQLDIKLTHKSRHTFRKLILNCKYTEIAITYKNTIKIFFKVKFKANLLNEFNANF